MSGLLNAHRAGSRPRHDRLPKAAPAPCVLGLLLAVLPSASAAQVEPIASCVEAERAADRDGTACIGRHAEPCQQKPDGQSTHGSAQCVRAETEAWDALLNREYRALTGALGRQTADRVRQSQRLWLRSREADCALPHALLEGGSMAQPMAAWCVLDRTARRALQLMRWRELVGGR